MKGSLGLAIARRQTEIPILDRLATAIPFVRPGVDESAGTSLAKGGSNLPVEAMGLRNLTVAAAVQPDFGKDKRQISRDILQSLHIGRQLGITFEINVESRKIEEGQFQIGGRRKIHIGGQSLRESRFGYIEELVKEALDTLAAMPTHNGSGNFVSDGETQDALMSAARLNLLTHISADV